MAAVLPHAPVATGTIHVIDPDDAWRRSIQSMLSDRFRCVVRGFRSVAAFVARADEVEAGVVVTDYVPAGGSHDAGDGDVLHALAGYRDKFVPLVVTAAPGMAVAVRAMKANAADVLARDADPDTLFAAVDAAMAQLARARAAAARDRHARATIASLSPRETDVLRGLIDGLPNKQIAHDLNLSPRTVEIYRAKLMTKLDVRSLSEVLRIAFTAGLFPDG